MYERFTDRARKVMQLANREAQRCNHDQMSAGHILAAMIKDGFGVGAHVLENCGVSLIDARDHLPPAGPSVVTMGKLPMDASARCVVANAVQAARKFDNNYVGTEHMVYGFCSTVPPLADWFDRQAVMSAVERLLDKSKTREPQYQPCVGRRSTMGPLTSWCWQEDPKHLAFTLARYKFVAKMLADCHDVLEVGCGDAFGSQIVRQAVGSLAVSDFDPVFLAAVPSELAPFQHDMTERPTQHWHDAIYCLDVMEHISPCMEERFLCNVVGSLRQHGKFIVGMPSLESQQYASAVSKAGHVNCKTGEQLRSTLSEYFNHVFVFSMNDEVVHTGFLPMASYLLAVCCEQRCKTW